VILPYFLSLDCSPITILIENNFIDRLAIRPFKVQDSYYSYGRLSLSSSVSVAAQIDHGVISPLYLRLGKRTSDPFLS